MMNGSQLATNMPERRQVITSPLFLRRIRLSTSAGCRRRRVGAQENMALVECLKATTQRITFPRVMRIIGSTTDRVMKIATTSFAL